MKTRDYFKALAQSFFLDRAWVGLALLAGVAAFSPEAALMAVAGSLLALLAAWQTTLPWTLREFGLIPLNGFFLGLGLYAYFPDTIQTWIYLAIGAFLIPTAASGLTAALAPFRLGVLILPALLLLWGFGLIPAQEIYLAPRSIAPEFWRTALFQLEMQGVMGQEWYPWASAFFESLSRWFFLPNAGLGLFLSLILLFASPRRFLAWSAGVILAAMTTLLFMPLIRSDEIVPLAFSSGVVTLGLVSLPEKVRPSRLALSSVLAVVTSFALSRAFLAAGLPLLSLPYIVSFWLVQLSLRPQVRVDRGLQTAGGSAGVQSGSSKSGARVFELPKASSKQAA